MPFYVYVLYSPSAKLKYTGQTEDLNRRLEEHNSGTLGKFTKGKGPWMLIHSETLPTRSLAMAREKFLKSGDGRAWIKRKYNV